MDESVDERLARIEGALSQLRDKTDIIIDETGKRIGSVGKEVEELGEA